mmetsp:Transcript_15412/g.20001  ORF Transcript_15412/g.20001 Transcript_15412/m.20001 type:complete len:97 (-) Transcript_15412:151-441(-)
MAATTGAFRRSLKVLGGGGHYHYPQHVWTPSGGWWANPPNWKVNTAIATGFVAFSFGVIFQFSAANERRPMPPREHIPSQSWCKHATTDDPSYVKK